MTEAKAQDKPDQLELPIARERVKDRNFEQGGRSIYLFDFDDNVMHLNTPIYVLDTKTEQERALSTGEFAQISHLLSKPGPHEHDTIIDDDINGSFRRFRDIEELSPGQRQPFVEDLDDAIKKGPLLWKGPSWDLFEHAVFNQRPLSIITARGHAPETIKEGIDALVAYHLLDARPNYLSVYPVSHPETKMKLSSSTKNLGVPALKKEAIIRTVHKAMRLFGENPEHRFGMSEDAPDNIELVIEAMRVLKKDFPRNAFFVIDSSTAKLVKTEVLEDSVEQSEHDHPDQLELF
jgi:hypothetical protein